MDQKEQSVYEVLDELGIVYQRHEHPPVYTVEEAEKYWADIEGVHCKNLFLRNQKGKRHFLVVLTDSKKVDFSRLSSYVGGEKLSFASDKRLTKYLGLETGAVSPFGLINDEQDAVEVLIDKDLKEADKINFHPNVNTATVTISGQDFGKFLDWTENSVSYIDI
ncbi:prolyl-tRNA synthetase associated domain-containing protein [Irregularibacter muris]|uniref:Prolyl-tRNA synthetase associated domain-containing protein n=1 Tax=Irregularibacter muris TaxID=1796619 RepID=A0AAE3HFF8_9FIRM|nr:prolyl-tRNA synthetase associated domain-containing protein [Irregularibacter muris]MCR1898522.1 prolyl-tRNA synthetase associated domain-containing protein [Irregularibacter muris]